MGFVSYVNLWMISGYVTDPQQQVAVKNKEVIEAFSLSGYYITRKRWGGGRGNDFTKLGKTVGFVLFLAVGQNGQDFLLVSSRFRH